MLNSIDSLNITVPMISGYSLLVKIKSRFILNTKLNYNNYKSTLLISVIYLVSSLRSMKEIYKFDILDLKKNLRYGEPLNVT